MTFETPFQFGDRDHIDGDASIMAVVTGFSFRPERYLQVEASWLSNGCAQSAWMDVGRVTLARARNGAAATRDAGSLVGAGLP